MGAEVRVADGEGGTVLQRSHTFVIEIDRQGAPGTVVEKSVFLWKMMSSVDAPPLSYSRKIYFDI